MSSFTSSLVSGFSAREAVAGCTPARAATSRRVTACSVMGAPLCAGRRPRKAAAPGLILRHVPWIPSQRRGTHPTREPRLVPGQVGGSGQKSGGRFSYGVLSTIVVRVETLAAARISESRFSSAAGEATRTFSM